MTGMHAQIAQILAIFLWEEAHGETFAFQQDITGAAAFAQENSNNLLASVWRSPDCTHGTPANGHGIVFFRGSCSTESPLVIEHGKHVVWTVLAKHRESVSMSDN